MPKYELGDVTLRGFDAFLCRWMHWIFRFVIFGGITAVAVFTVLSERRMLFFAIAFLTYIAVVVVLQTWALRMTKRVAVQIKEHRRKGSIEQQQSVQNESETLASWSKQAKERKRREPTMSEVNRDPYEFRSPDIDWASLGIDDFPTFSPGEIEYDEALAEAELKDDTLLFDSTGHGVDLEDDLFKEGLWVAFDLLAMNESEWCMLPWGYEELFAIEVIAAASGKPSQSRQCGRLRAWSKRVNYQPSPELAADLLRRIDRHLGAICEDPEGKDVSKDALGILKQQAYLMRQRISDLPA